MEFIFIFTIVFIQILFIDFTKIVKVVRTLGVHTFMDDEVLAVLFGNEGIPTVRAAELDLGKTAFFGRESGITDLAEKLSFVTVVLVRIRCKKQ